MSLPIFDLSLLSNNYTTCFNAVFIDQESYLKLLNVCDGYFGLNMTITVVDGIIKYPDQTDMDSAYYQLYNLKE